MPASAAEVVGNRSPGAQPAALTLSGVACTFVSKDAPGQRYTAVENVDLHIGAGEFVSVVGPTGLGAPLWPMCRQGWSSVAPH